MVKRQKKSHTLFAFIVVFAILAVGFYLYADISKKAELARYPKKYSEYVEKYAWEFGIPSEILYSVILTESGFNPHAVSSAGAIGLMQITPDTYDWLLYLRKEESSGKLTDPETNIKYGAYFLSYLYGKFGKWDTVFAAYNAGLNRVNAWIDDPRYSDGSSLVNIPYKETENYIKKVNNAIEKYIKLYQV